MLPLAVFVLTLISGACCYDYDLIILLLSQPNEFHRSRADIFHEHIANQLNTSELKVRVLPLHDVFKYDWGGWAVWPVMNKIYTQYKQQTKWFMVAEEETRIHLPKLSSFLDSLDYRESIYSGYALFDKDSTIIHHYAFAGNNPSSFKYPDFAAGLIFSMSAVGRVLKKLSVKDAKRPDFIIDAKHEIAMLLWDNGRGLGLLRNDGFCTFPYNPESCFTYYLRDSFLRACANSVTKDDLYIAVKTYHGFHKTRVVVAKRTWAAPQYTIEYYSDRDDIYIPTINLGINNTARGHCAKTFGIMKRFQDPDVTKAAWLVIVDDDTLLSIPRLMKLLRCYDPSDSVILGERYAYGFTTDGTGGYEYPTGGSGMIFSRAAVDHLFKSECGCPMPESPDDMIIGMCARHAQIPILHNSGFHQARPIDYANDYLRRSIPISFHKHDGIDPFRVYVTYLADEDDDDDELSRKRQSSSPDKDGSSVDHQEL